METLYNNDALSDHSYTGQSDQLIKTLAISSYPLVLKGISELLKDEPNINYLSSTSNKLEMMLRIQEFDPSLIIINDDEVVTETSATLENIKYFISEYPNIRILLTINSHDFKKEINALEIGVRGILSGNFDGDTLINCINTLEKGGLWIRRSVMEKFITKQIFLNRNRNHKHLEFPSFTKREVEIMHLASGGQKNKDIAENLFISEKTVKHHLTRIFKKLNIKKRTQLKRFV